MLGYGLLYVNEGGWLVNFSIGRIWSKLIVFFLNSEVAFIQLRHSALFE